MTADDFVVGRRCVAERHNARLEKVR